MNVQDKDHTSLRELLYLEIDGELKAGERSRLQQHLSDCSDCRQERRELAVLDRLIADSAIEVEPSFTREVMDGLPAAGWESRSPRTWWLALAAVLLLSMVSLALVGSAGEDALVTLPIGAVSAIWDFASTSALAGAGLLAASWKGMGIALQDVLGRSVWNLVAFGVLVFCLDFLLLRTLWSRRTAAERAGQTRDK